MHTPPCHCNNTPTIHIITWSDIDGDSTHRKAPRPLWAFPIGTWGWLHFRNRTPQIGLGLPFGFPFNRQKIDEFTTQTTAVLGFHLDILQQRCVHEDVPLVGALGLRTWGPENWAFEALLWVGLCDG